MPTGPQCCSCLPETSGPGWNLVCPRTQTTSRHPAGTRLKKKSFLNDRYVYFYSKPMDLVEVRGSLPFCSPQCCPGVFPEPDTSWGKLATRPVQHLYESVRHRTNKETVDKQHLFNSFQYIWPLEIRSDTIMSAAVMTSHIYYTDMPVLLRCQGASWQRDDPLHPAVCWSRSHVQAAHCFWISGCKYKNFI